MTTSWAETETTWNKSPRGDGVDDRRRRPRVAAREAGRLERRRHEGHLRRHVAGQVGGEPAALGASRYTRIALVDLDPATVDSTREFYTPDDANSALRPTLTVVYGARHDAATAAAARRRPAQHFDDAARAPVEFAARRRTAPTAWPTSIASSRRRSSFKPDIVSFNEVERFRQLCELRRVRSKIAALMKQYSGQTWYYKFATHSGSANGKGT